MKVLEEIDKHKKRQDAVGTNARNIIRDTPLLEIAINNKLKNYLYDNIIKYIIKNNLYRL